ncbi:hypothetical protein DH2020_013334 [Rehmannia glutinosa]|uniref:OVATE domain-containing protein n=1 Tax=Rehmannia glutinosa TaxID=99300 RepID=A0ABR0X2N2_REHGL
MSSKPCRTELKPQMLMKESFYRAKRFVQKTSRNIKFFLSKANQKPPKNSLANPIFSGSKKISSKLQEPDNFYKSFSKQWDSSELVNEKEALLSTKEQTKGNVSDNSGLDDLNEEKKANTYLGGTRDESHFLASYHLAQKMKEMEMIDEIDEDHVLDIEEVLHYYSLLSSPAYLEIVDKFLMDMCSEFNLSKPSSSVNSSMRELDSNSVHSSMRKLGSTSIDSSMRKLDSTSVHTSMRKLGSTSVHSSMRKLDSTSVHSSMRKLGSTHIHSSTRKPESTSVHSSMRKLGSTSIHSSMRSLGPLKL